MPTVRSILDGLAAMVPWAKAAGWDPVGLNVGAATAGVTRVGVCHDVTGAVLDAAEAASVDLLLAYHPLLFEPTRRLVAGSGPGGLAFRAAASGLAIAVAHTAFDVAPGGSADALAEALGLDAVRPFAPMWPGPSAKVVTFAPPDAIDELITAMSAAGAGAIGAYSGCSYRSRGEGTFLAGPGTAPTVGTPGEATRVAEDRLEMVVPASRVDAVVAALVTAHPYEEPAFDVIDRRGDVGFVGRVGTWEGDLAGLTSRVTAHLGGVVRVARPPGVGAIARVAVVPGSGASLLREAAGTGADVIVTGDVKHHDARSAVAAGLAVIDPGHAATERPGVAKLYAAVAAGGVDTIDLTAIDADPWAT